MADKRLLRIRFYRATIDDLQIPDTLLPALAMRDVIRATILELKSYKCDGCEPTCAEILDESGTLLERVVLTPNGIRLTTSTTPDTA